MQSCPNIYSDDTIRYCMNSLYENLPKNTENKFELFSNIFMFCYIDERSEDYVKKTFSVLSDILKKDKLSNQDFVNLFSVLPIDCALYKQDKLTPEGFFKNDITPIESIIDLNTWLVETLNINQIK